jgi:hypothetical protein
MLWNFLLDLLELLMSQKPPSLVLHDFQLDPWWYEIVAGSSSLRILLRILLHISIFG